MTAVAPVVELAAYRGPGPADIAGHRGYVLGILAACGVPHRDRDVVAQDVLVDAWLAIRQRRIRNANRPDAVRAYLRGIAWRHAWDYRERAVAQVEELLADPLAALSDRVDPSPSPLDVLLERERAALVAVVVARLPRLSREALRSAADHESLTGCAAALGVPITTAHNRIRIAAERVRAALRRADARQSAAQPAARATSRKVLADLRMMIRLW